MFRPKMSLSVVDTAPMSMRFTSLTVRLVEIHAKSTRHTQQKRCAVGVV